MESLVFTEVKIYFIHVEFDRIVRKKKYKHPRKNTLKGRLAMRGWLHVEDLRLESHLLEVLLLYKIQSEELQL